MEYTIKPNPIRPMKKEEIAAKFKEALIFNNLAFVLTETVNSFFIDMTSRLRELGLSFKHDDKRNFTEMLKSIERAKYCSDQIAKHLYELEDMDDALRDADWWYLLIKLINDRLGTDNRKTHILLEFIDKMPSEGIFKVNIEDFQKL